MVIIAKKIYSCISDKQKKLLIVFFLLTLLSLFFELFGLGLLIPIFSIILSPDKIELNSHFVFIQKYIPISDPNLLSLFLITFLGLIYIIKNFFLYLFNVWRYNFIYGIRAYVTNELYKKYVSQELKFHNQKNSSTLITNVSEVSTFTDVINQITILIIELFLILGIISILFYFHFVASFLTILLVFSLSYIFYKFNKKKLNQNGVLRYQQEKEKIKYLQQSLGGIAELKVFQVDDFFYKNFKNSSNNVVRAAKNLELYLSLPRLWFESVAVLAVCFLIVLLINSGLSFLEIIPFISFFAVSGFKMVPSLNRVLNSIQFINFYQNSVNKISDEFLSLKSINIDDNRLKDRLKNNDKNISKIIFENINFNYGDTKIFENFSHSMDVNKTLGIHGKSGEGKTTLLYLMLGLLTPSNGKIYYKDDKDNNIPLQDVKFSFVPQKIFLNDDTILNNIVFGREELNTKSNIERVIKISKLGDLIDSLPDGINTKIGERGCNLSGGQIQRVAIARAILDDPKIILFDEATSSLDPQTTESVLKELEDLKKHFSIILISHNQDVFKICDKVYKLIDKKLINAKN